MKSPIEVQEQALKKIIYTAKNTEFGILNGFNYLRNSKEFKNRVSINKYENLLPFIERSKNGEANILWPGKVKWFAQSSGTSSNTIKHIPITIDSLKKCHYKGGKDLLAIYYRKTTLARQGCPIT